MRILLACAAGTAKTYHTMIETHFLALNPGWYCIDPEDYIRSRTVNPDARIVFKTVEHDHLTAFLIIYFPGNTPDGLGHYMDLEPEALDRMARMNSLTIRPSFRGRGLQYQLTASAEQYLITTSYCHLMGTVHPGNRYSLGNFLKLEYRIATATKKYGRLPRYVLYKSINSPPFSTGSGNSAASISMYLK